MKSIICWKKNAYCINAYIRRQTSLFKCSSEKSQGHISETTRWIFIFKRWKFRKMSPGQEDPSRYTRTLVVKPALSQMYDQLLPTSKSLEMACKNHCTHTSVPRHVNVPRSRNLRLLVLSCMNAFYLKLLYQWFVSYYPESVVLP